MRSQHQQNYYYKSLNWHFCLWSVWPCSAVYVSHTSTSIMWQTEKMQINVRFRKGYSCKGVLLILHTKIHIQAFMSISQNGALLSLLPWQLFSAIEEELYLHCTAQVKEERALPWKVLTASWAMPQWEPLKQHTGEAAAGQGEVSCIQA